MYTAVVCAVVGRASCRSTWTCSSTASTRYVQSTHIPAKKNKQMFYIYLYPSISTLAQFQIIHLGVPREITSGTPFQARHPIPSLPSSHPSLSSLNPAGDVKGRHVPQLPERELDRTRVRLRLCTSTPAHLVRHLTPAHSVRLLFPVLGFKSPPPVASG